MCSRCSSLVVARDASNVIILPILLTLVSPAAPTNQGEEPPSCDNSSRNIVEMNGEEGGSTSLGVLGTPMDDLTAIAMVVNMVFYWGRKGRNNRKQAAAPFSQWCRLRRRHQPPFCRCQIRGLPRRGDLLLLR